jgi:hypothetical protein
MPQQLIRCSQCHKRPEEKLSQVTWAWLRADHVRVAYRQRLCVTCFCVAVLALDKPLDAEGAATCPACGMETEDDMDPIYCTAFIPGQGKLRVDMPLCAPHAAEVRVRAQEGAERLEDREAWSRGQAPGTAPSPDEVWAALGRFDPAGGSA